MPGGSNMGGALQSLATQQSALTDNGHTVVLGGASLPVSIQGAILLVGAGIVSWAAISDLRSNIIPNAANVALFVLWTGWVISGANAQIWPSLGIGIGIFLLGAVLFHFGQMGGGDVKFLTVMGIWAGPSEVLPFLIQVAFAGGLLTMAWIVHGRLVAPALGRVIPTESKRSVPYGVAIGAGAFLLFARLWT